MSPFVYVYVSTDVAIPMMPRLTREKQSTEPSYGEASENKKREGEREREKRRERKRASVAVANKKWKKHRERARRE